MQRSPEDYEDANSEASDAQHSVRGVLRVTAPTTFGAMHLGGVIASYLAAYPDVTVETTLSDRHVELLAEGLDLAIRIGELRDSELVARRLAPCRMVFCAAPSFLAQHGVPESVEDLRRAPRLAFSEAVSPGDWTVTDPQGVTHLINGPVRLAANSMQMLLAAALAGAGVAYGPTFVFGEHIARGELRVLIPGHRASELTIHAVYPTRRHVSLKLRRFVEHLTASLGGVPPWDLTMR